MGTALAQGSPTGLQAVAKGDAWGHPQSPLLTACVGARSSLLPVWGHEAFLQKAEDSWGCSELKQKKIAGREDANTKCKYEDFCHLALKYLPNQSWLDLLSPTFYPWIWRSPPLLHATRASRQPSSIPPSSSRRTGKGSCKVFSPAQWGAKHPTVQIFEDWCFQTLMWACAVGDNSWGRVLWNCYFSWYYLNASICSETGCGGKNNPHPDSFVPTDKGEELQGREVASHHTTGKANTGPQQNPNFPNPFLVPQPLCRTRSTWAK